MDPFFNRVGGDGGAPLFPNKGREGNIGNAGEGGQHFPGQMCKRIHQVGGFHVDATGWRKPIRTTMLVCALRTCM